MQGVAENADVQRFLAVAEEFCDVVESLSDLHEPNFLARMDELLPLVYALASRLPYPFDRQSDGDDDDDTLAPRPRPLGMSFPDGRRLWEQQRDSIGSKLGSHRWFQFVHDPVDTGDKEVIDADLADVLSNIYVGLKEGLALFGRASDLERAWAVFDWRTGVDSIWGRHVAEAILPIHSLIHWHYDEDDEVFDV